MPSPNALACPYCGAPVEDQRERCPGCDARLLYGLVAPPQADPRLQDRVAAVLGAVPGGPPRLEARRRVREGLPLIVGLTRRRTEELQGRLVDLGLIPRIGPAPRGTAPLEPERAHRGLVGRVAVALAIPVVAFALFRLLERERPRPPAAEAPSAAATAEAVEAPVVEVNAGFQRERHGHLWLLVAARWRGEGRPPDVGVAVRLRDETGTVLWTGSVPTHEARDLTLRVGDTEQTQRTVQERFSLRDLFLQGGERLTFEATWQVWESEPLAVEVPKPVPLRRSGRP